MDNILYSSYTIDDQNVKNKLKKPVKKLQKLVIIIAIIGLLLAVSIGNLEKSIWEIFLFTYIFILTSFFDIYFLRIKVKRKSKKYSEFVKKSAPFWFLSFTLLAFTEITFSFLIFILILVLITTALNCYFRKSYNIFYAPTFYIIFIFVFLGLINQINFI